MATSLRSCLGKSTPGLSTAWRKQQTIAIIPELSSNADVRGAVAAAAGPRRLAIRAAPAAASTAAAATCKGCCCGASASVAAAGVFGVSAATWFTASSALMVPMYGLMAFFPTLRLTRDLLFNSCALYVGLSLLYATTLVGAWQAGLGTALAGVVSSVHSAVLAGCAVTAIDLSPLAAMFSQPLVTLLSWLHLLALDALMAREIALDGIRTSNPTAHSVLLCFFFGPMGLLSHALTRLLWGKVHS
ncbi:hypothetical protein VaNZ11_005775 [Volvox africanus]|uniref:Uncharacterized protein n=1 Tax=Volvox africanus TaxID=51714 RepID=A0ABQ5RZM1_9CHLO|nr:hypothetical protein VaNZ11_005775 [Volvox africanus]